MKQSFFVFVVLTAAFFLQGNILGQESSMERGVAISEQTQECITCHNISNAGIVEDWRSSRHAQMTPEKAVVKPKLERRISSDSVPDSLKSVAVGCYECHSMNAAEHPDTFEHFGYVIHTVVSPNDCQTCHPEEVEQYSGSKKAHALDILQKNSVYHNLVVTTTRVKEFTDGQLTHSKASETTKNETCYACHGSRVSVKGTKIIETYLGDVEVPILTNWPNQGVGRVNPDGSRGACTACHPRHSFSIEIARQPYTCSQCHLHPDVPAWEVYKESKHGNIFFSKQHDWNLNNVPWTVGKDFNAPSCAVCHNSLLVTPDEELIVQRTHDFGARLWVRIFGLIYSHPQPKSGKTYEIRNQNGLPLPTTFTGELESEFLIDEEEQTRRQKEMQKVCQNCHGANWVRGHFVQLDTTNMEADQMVLAATQLLQQAWDEGLADPANPFDEAIEQKWIEQWLFFANSVRYASAMGGQDYATFKNGWWELTRNLQEMQDRIGLKAK
ncbi:hydroxylamine oxidase [candidate division KSB1 bacterium]|nr:hydroxylamine oxidase [candidate division KSB1 bacterium]NIR72772.1 hydroxylamine oxidase [candidate division KSB1 bacterium]NIS23728.1 hydroxylamine oxidase [candidate division KSB1 bacterium]NIT70648.1 hydroxylamine oxidase [candidate division KSB1 bacterium]NIU24376.1 hydroxylamine oxidase [candidate division KSB1 bacterium]